MLPDSQHTPSSPAEPAEAGGKHDATDVERIFREHNDALLRFIAAKLGSKQEAHEVAQEAYVKLLSLEHREAVSYLRAFLFKTAANLATDRLRRRSRRAFVVSGASLDRAVFDLSPEREVAGEQAIARMREAIDELPPKCREAFLLSGRPAWQSAMTSVVDRGGELPQSGTGRERFPPARSAGDVEGSTGQVEGFSGEVEGSTADVEGFRRPRPLVTTFTCSAETPEQMAQTARSFANARAIKLKLTGEPVDADRVRAVCEALPQAWLSVDANQGFTRPFLEELMPVLVGNDVSLIEQPFPIGEEALLEGFRSPIPVAADESVQGLSSLPALVGRFDMANIKLDKCGGLTEGLMMARELRALGLDVMVGCMGGTSLAMAPAYLLGQLCDVVDLDGPAFIRSDREPPARYVDGHIECPPELWGHPARGPDL
jgi:RNA polymerase sigma factor (sigma-70 family)